MRDIQEDLRQRLVKISAQRGELKARLAWLDEMEVHLKSAMEYERMQSEFGQATLFETEPPDIGERSPVVQFLRDMLSDFEPRSLDEMKSKASARGLDFKGKNPGRVLHFTLVGMAQTGQVANLGGGSWQLTAPRTPHINGSAVLESV